MRVWYHVFIFVFLLKELSSNSSFQFSKFSIFFHPFVVVNVQVTKSPFVERLLKKGYEVIYLTEPVDEYCIQSLPEFEGKKFQNVAKEGMKLDQSEKAKEYREQQEKEFEPLLKWLKDSALNDKVKKLLHFGYPIISRSICNRANSAKLLPKFCSLVRKANTKMKRFTNCNCL